MRLGLHCEVTIDGYTDFIFINRFGQAQHQATLNKAIRRIIRDCNDEQFLHSDEPDVLLPHFSCHSLRHTFTTRMCEAGVNIKVIQDALGHSDISTTLNIYLILVLRYKELTGGGGGIGGDDVPYDLAGYITEIDTGLIDSDYMNSRFDKYIKFKVSDKPLDGYRHFGRLVASMKNYEV